MNTKSFVAFAVALMATSFVVAPTASADAAVCAVAVCTQTNTETQSQVYTCGGSGNIIIITGDNSSANVCTGGQNQTQDSGGYFLMF